jgi:hypothetical protein
MMTTNNLVYRIILTFPDRITTFQPREIVRIPVVNLLELLIRCNTFTSAVNLFDRGLDASFPQLKLNVEGQARRLAIQLDKPRMIRVLSHTFPALQVYAYDAVVDQRILLASDAAWGAGGEIAEENTPEENDLFEDDLSSSGDVFYRIDK